MMEPIAWNGQVLAYVIRGTMTADKTVFPIPHEVELQVGFVVYPAGGVVAPHRHSPITRTITRTCEVVVVKIGRCDVDLYADTPTVVATQELRTGDILLIVSGGHGFRMIEDTILLEIKQGPYFGLDEKELIS
jgi:quercetin dioxygenase-like cupin family protein